MKVSSINFKQATTSQVNQNDIENIKIKKAEQQRQQNKRAAYVMGGFGLFIAGLFGFNRISTINKVSKNIKIILEDTNDNTKEILYKALESLSPREKLDMTNAVIKDLPTCKNNPEEFEQFLANKRGQTIYNSNMNFNNAKTNDEPDPIFIPIEDWNLHLNA